MVVVLQVLHESFSVYLYASILSDFLEAVIDRVVFALRSLLVGIADELNDLRLLIILVLTLSLLTHAFDVTSHHL